MSHSIRRVEVPNEFSSAIISDDTVIVVLDVYMFSTTVLTLHEVGVEQVIPVYNPDELDEYADQGLLVGGEQGGQRDFSNSPQNVYGTFGVMDSIPSRVALTSDNGARRCVEAVESIEDEGFSGCEVLIGSSVNAQYIAEYIQENYPTHDIVLLCAGSGGEATIEDVIGGLAISQYLRDETVPVIEYEEMLSMLPAGRINGQNEYEWLADEDVHHVSAVNSIQLVSRYDFEEEVLRQV